jgi:plastocyanin
VYALVASLALVAPLAASDTVPPAEVPEAAAERAPAQESTPAPEQAPGEESQEPAVQETAPEPAPAAPAPAAPEPAAPTPDPQQLVDPRAEPRRGRAAPTARAAASGAVTIRDFDFAPATVTVSVGDTVTWTNAGPTAHTATASNGSFDTGLLSEGQSGSHTFRQAGSFSYYCAPHPNMKGTVVVQAAAGGDEPTSSDDSAGDDTSAGTTTNDGAESAAAQDEGATLPSTGLDSGGLALLGAATLLLGIHLRRRARHL